MIWKRRGNRGAGPAGADQSADGEPSPEAVLVTLLSETSTGQGWETVQRLVDHLFVLDRRDDHGPAEQALTQLRSAPRAVARLDEYSRRVLWSWDVYAPSINDVVGRVKQGTAGPIALALASTHGDGRVREIAVRRMLVAPRRWSAATRCGPGAAMRCGGWRGTRTHRYGRSP